MDSRHILAVSPTSIRSTRPPAKRRDISHTPPLGSTHSSISFCLLASSCFLHASRSLISPDHYASPAVSLASAFLSPSLFEWRAIELLWTDKRETQFKLRLLAVCYGRYYNVSVSRRFPYIHVHAGSASLHRASRSEFTEERCCLTPYREFLAYYWRQIASRSMIKSITDSRDRININDTH